MTIDWLVYFLVDIHDQDVMRSARVLKFSKRYSIFCEPVFFVYVSIALPNRNPKAKSDFTQMGIKSSNMGINEFCKKLRFHN